MNQKNTLFTAVFLAAGALAASVTGCELLATVDRGQINGTGGATGGTGGGTTSSTTVASTTGSGGTTSSSGTGGAMCPGGAQSCGTPQDCPDPMSECVTRSCDASGCCGTNNVASGTQTVSGQMSGDCKLQVCDGNGAATSSNDDLDLPEDNNPCTQDACNAGVPSNTPITGPCTLGGNAAVCGDPAGTAKGTCVACNVDNDCSGTPATPFCSANVCVPAQCMNLAQDTGETDIDCGGTVCGKCVDTKKCLVNSDCTHGFCDGTLHCATPTCGDTAQNGNETDLNCGGTGFQGAGACPPCANALKCGVNADCTSGFCDQMVTPHICKTPSCTDGQKNGTETGTDCGGATCDALGKTCAVGAACNNSADCTSGFCQGATCALKPIGTACGAGAECAAPSACIDGVCCDTAACNGTCQACSATAKGQGADGACGGVKAGTDAKNQCASSAQSTCGNDGSCDGTGSSAAPGACEKWSNATVCATPIPACVGSTLTANSLCSGAGTCNAGATSSCGAYNCNAGGTACLTACTLDTECTAGNYCNGAACVPVKAAGVACGKNSACTSGICGTTGTGNCCLATCSTAGACGATGCDATGACAYPGNTTAPAGLQTPGDCQAIVCNGAGSTTPADDFIDLPTSNTVCLINPSCAGVPAAPHFDPAPTGTNCTADNKPGKIVCGSGVFAGTCVECNVGTDCPIVNDAGPPPTCSASHVCQ
jgi:hypothetical protein